MIDILNKLSISSKDYIACIDTVDERILFDIYNTVKGIVCVGRTTKKNFDGFQNIKILKSAKQLDESIFNKILANYSEDLNLKYLFDSTENLGLVLICNVPHDKESMLSELLERKAGIFDFWSFKNNTKNTVDILFKVRKY